MAGNLITFLSKQSLGEGGLPPILLERILLLEQNVRTTLCAKTASLAATEHAFLLKSCVIFNQTVTTCRMKQYVSIFRISPCAHLTRACVVWDLPSDQFEHFDWTRHKGPSSTKGTGPPFDHTNGTLEGYYMYIESSKWKMLDQATLESPVFPSVPKNTNSRCMFRFYYHMMGRTVGELTIKLLDLCSPQVHNRIPTRVWHKEGQQGKSWLYAEVPITNMTSRYAVHISGTGGFQNQGDIAIDDLSLSPGCFGIDFQSDPVKDISEDREIITIQEFTKDVKFHCQILKDNPPSSVKAPNETSTSDSTKGKLKGNIHNTTVPGATVYISENNGKIGTVYIAVITVSGIAISFILCAAFLCFSFRQRKAQCEQNSHLEMVTTPSDENNPVSSAVQAANFDMQLRCAVTELNPNYDFITAKYPEQQLREIPRNKLKLIRLLGQGAFGEVYEGTLKNMCANVSELSVAVKTLPALSTQQAETDFMMEAVIISKFMHKNVVKCLGVCFEEHPRYIILELLEGGDLKTFLRDSRPKTDQHYFLSMKELVHLSLDVANGCRHLEEKHFVHRDIAARNCLLTTRGEGRIAKIADFGMSRDIYSADYYRKSGKTMLPIKWMPPEAFLDGVFTTKTDVWSFGVLLWEMFTLGYMPYPGQTNSDVMQFVSSGGRLDPPEKCPARLNKIMILCWNSIADIRPTFSEIIELLDMCLQDDEVLNAPVGLCHFAMAESFKDASTLAKSSSYDADNQEIDTTLHSPSPSSAAEFRPQFESQSREPLLMASQDQ
ncbi:hypothetical protein DPMN_088862 [Dreissena polymorpha]|uniref:Tyrosine-protein kinase receptor n=2 Tax=Dreissena polymorpha TaxID=45954 RepID=A0A9D4KUV6_DREPO|nr:hypothetical protein DPMN_088862 [Dreissena polymorpha]